MSSIPQAYYVYVLARPNGRAFYVGKGKGRRTFDHEKEARSGHKCHKCNVIRKIWREGGQVQCYIVFTTTDEDEAYQYERDLVASYGRKNLTNGTDGGEGLKNPTSEVRRRLAEAARGKSPANKGKPLSEAAKRHLSELNKGKSLPEHVKQNLIRINTGQHRSDKTRNKIAFTQRNGQLYTIVSPEGDVYRNVANLRGFEREHGLPISGLQQALGTRAKRAAGWGIVKEGEPLPPLLPSFTLVAPDGTKYTGVHNVAAFAKEHGIDGHAIRAVIRGKARHHRGWTGYRETPE